MSYAQVLNQNQKISTKTPNDFDELGGPTVTEVCVLSDIKGRHAFIVSCLIKMLSRMIFFILENRDIGMHSGILRQKFRHLASI